MFLQKALGIEFPFIQGGMAHIATGDFAAAVSEAGGLGTVAAGGLSTEGLREQIRRAKEKTDKPFAVNLMLLHPERDRMAEIVMEEGVPILTTGAGNPSKYMSMWKAAGIKVFPVVPSPALGLRMERAGADGLIAEGLEAGGHIGQMTTMTLLPQMIDRVTVPVIAAGGIASGDQMFAAEILGASGFQMGTLFLATEECPIHVNYKEKLLAAGDAQVTVIGNVAGLANRVLKNQMTRDYQKREREGASMEELEVYTLGALKRAVREGDVIHGSLMAGLVAGQIVDILPLRDRMENLYQSYLECKKRYGCN